MDTMERLEIILNTHDEQPETAADHLRQIDPKVLDMGQKVMFCSLTNHIIGEKLSDWSGAYKLLVVDMGEIPPAVARFRASAAFLAGQPIDGWRHQDEFKLMLEVDDFQAGAMVQLTVFQNAFPGNEGSQSMQRQFSNLIAQIERTEFNDDTIATSLAMMFNNIGSLLLDSEFVDPTLALHRETLEKSALLSNRFWCQTGGWVEKERSYYLVAMAMNKTGSWKPALEAAETGLKLIEENGEEQVDQAFLLLEKSRSLRNLNEIDAAEQANAQAVELSKTFEATLIPWFQRRSEIASS